MGCSGMRSNVMASEETWVILGRGHMHTSSRGWVFSSPFSVCWKRSVCLAEGSNCNGQDFSCPQPGVQSVIANSLWAGVKDWRGKPARVCRRAATQPYHWD